MASIFELETLRPEDWERYSRIKQSEKYWKKGTKHNKNTGEAVLAVDQQAILVHQFIAKKPGCTYQDIQAHFFAIKEHRIRDCLKVLSQKGQLSKPTRTTYSALPEASNLASKA